MMNVTDAVVSVLVRGRGGMGVGRVEARELARRFGGGDRGGVVGSGEYAPVKFLGEWYVVHVIDLVLAPGEVPHVDGSADAWSVGQVADYLYARERGRFLARPRPGYVVGRPASEVTS